MYPIIADNFVILSNYAPPSQTSNVVQAPTNFVGLVEIKRIRKVKGAGVSDTDEVKYRNTGSVYLLNKLRVT